MDYNGDRYGLQYERLVVGDNFNPEVGFLRRDNFARHALSAEFAKLDGPLLPFADGQFDELPTGLHQAANFRSEGGEQKVARERAVEPLEPGRGVKHTQLNPLSYAVGEAAYFITRPARDITRVKLMRHNYIRMGSTTSWLDARKQSATSLSGRMSTELRRSSIKSANCR